jgi:hypothetical protein
MQKAFCSKCGGGLIDGVCPQCADTANNPVQQVKKPDPSAKFKGFFMSPKEKLVATLGNTFIQNFLAGGMITKGFSVVSDKRVYFRGTTYFVDGKKIRKMAESKTVDLKDVTGTSVTTFSRPLLLFLIPAVILFIVISAVVMTMSATVGVSGGGGGAYNSVMIVVGLSLSVNYKRS